MELFIENVQMGTSVARIIQLEMALIHEDSLRDDGQTLIDDRSQLLIAI